MNKIYILSYEKSERDCPALVVAETNITSPNENLKIVNVIVGDYAEELIKELTKEVQGNEKRDDHINKWSNY